MGNLYRAERHPMSMRMILAVVGIAGAMAACTRVAPPSGGASTGDGATQALLEKAQKLAESELARLSAAEMIYRNKVYDHVYIDEDNGVRTDILMKYYRSFRAAEVVDVKRTDSLLFPVEFIIQYDYDLIGTGMEAGLPATMAKAAKKVKNDTAFQVYSSESLTRQYRCDSAGDCDILDPDLLPRPNYWELNAWAKKYGVLQVDDMSLLAGS